MPFAGLLNGAAIEQGTVYEHEVFEGHAVTIHSSVLELDEKSIRTPHG